VCVCVFLGMKAIALQMVGMCSTTSSPKLKFFFP
jgi:hypothetical protein